MNRVRTIGRLSALLLGLAGLFASSARPADLIVTATKPDRLFVVDAARRAVRAEYHLPDADGFVSTLLISPDGRIAYVLVAGMERIVGIELATGRAVFRAELSSSGERVKCFAAMALTPDGRELIVHELPTRLEPSEYVVEQPRFAIFRTDGGMTARPVRTFEAPRRIHMLLARPNGTSFYALGFDLYEYDLRNGKLLGTRGIQKWGLPEHGQPDLLAIWPVTGPAGVFTSPIYSSVTRNGESTPTTALMSLDLKSGALDYADFEAFSALIFSTVLSPDRAHAYGVYTTLSRIDVRAHRLEKRVPLDHTFYAVNLSSDGREVYTGGTECDIGVYDAATLEKRALLKLPGCGDQVLATLQVVREH